MWFLFWPVFVWTCVYAGFLLGDPEPAPWPVSAGLWLVGVAVFGLIGWSARPRPALALTDERVRRPTGRRAAEMIATVLLSPIIFMGVCAMVIEAAVRPERHGPDSRWPLV